MNKYVQKLCRYGLLLLFTALLPMVTQAQTPVVYQDGKRAGVLSVKLQPETANMVAAQRSLSLNGKLHTGLSAFDATAQSFGATTMERIFPYNEKNEAKHRKHGLHLWYRVKINNEADIASAVKALSQTAGVSIAEPVLKKELVDGYKSGTAQTIVPGPTRAKAAVTDPRFGDQWHYNNTGQYGGTPGEDINLLKAWEITMGNPNVIVSIHDEGLDVKHEDLKSNVWINETELNGLPGVDDDRNGFVDDVYGYDFTSDQGDFPGDEHATHVAGTVAATNNNGIGVSGVAGGSGKNDGVRLMGLKILSGADVDNIALSYIYAADNGAVISQNSWGSTEPYSFEQVILDAIDYFIEEAGGENSPMNGGLVIFAAGNSNSNLPYYPAYYDKVIAVSALGNTGKKTSYSNGGPWVDISAPGGGDAPTQVLSTLPNNQYGYLSGTSMAAPHVSGVAALILSKYGRKNFFPEELKQRLLTGVRDVEPLNNTPNLIGQLGRGASDALRALQDDQKKAPEAVVDLALAEGGDGYAQLKWTVPADEDDERPDEFQIYYHTAAITEANLNAAKSQQLFNAKAPGQEQGIKLTLNPGTDYYFVVAAKDRWGNKSALSNEVHYRTIDPGKLVVDKTALRIDLSAPSNMIGSDQFTLMNEGVGPLIWKGMINRVNKPMINPTVNAAASFIPTQAEGLRRSSESFSSSVSVVPVIAAERSAFETQEITYVDLMTSGGVGNGVNLSNSSATRFQAGKEGFNLTALKTRLSVNSAQYGPIRFEVYKGGAEPLAENLLLSVSKTLNSNGLSDNMISLPEQLLFAADEVFWIVVHVNSNVAQIGPDDLPLGAALLLSGVTPPSGTFKYSTNLGMDWETLGNNFDGYGWSISALSQDANVPGTTVLSPADGRIVANAEQLATVTANAEKLINGEYAYMVAVTSDDPETSSLRIPLTITVAGHPPVLSGPSLVNMGNGFIGRELKVRVRLENAGYGAFSVASKTSSDARFSLGELPLVAARGEEELEITLTPDVVGNYNSNITVVSSTGIRYSFAVSASATAAPKVVIEPVEMQLSMKAGEEQDLMFKINNEGGYPLEYVIPKFSDGQIDGIDRALTSDFGYSYSILSGDDYQWNDISTTGVDLTVPFITKYWHPVEFNMDFFGTKVKQLYISKFGHVAFDNEPEVPASGAVRLKLGSTLLPDGYVAGLLYNFSRNASKVYLLEEPDKLTIQYDVGLAEVALAYRASFQGVFHKNGDIEWAYDNLDTMPQEFRDQLFIGMESIGKTDRLGIQQEGLPIGLQSKMMVKLIHPGSNIISSVGNPKGATLANASSEIPFKVNIDPATVDGSYTQNLTLLTSDPLSPYAHFTLNVEVTGGSPLLTADKESVDFGSVVQGSVQQSELFIKNAGLAAVTISSVALTGKRFTVQDVPETVLKPEETIKLVLETDSNAAAGLVEDELIITPTAGTALTVAVKALFTLPPMIEVATTALHQDLVANETAVQPLTITNIGTGVLEVDPNSAPWLSLIDPVTDTKTGYQLTDNNSTAGPNYEWIDVVKDGTKVNWIREENAYAKIDLPFDFEFYGKTYRSLVAAKQYGMISFERTLPLDLPVNAIPSVETPNTFIAPFLAGITLFGDEEETGLFYKAYEDKFVMTYAKAFPHALFNGGRVSFQVIFYKNGSIKYQYQLPTDLTELQLAALKAVIVGIENEDGTNGTEVTRNKQYLKNGMAIMLNPVQRLYLQAGESVAYNLKFDAKDLSAGEYSADLNLRNNTPGKEEIAIPVSLTVIGTPLLTSSSEDVDFGHLYLYKLFDPGNGLEEQLFSLTNEGGATANITAMDLDDTSGLSVQMLQNDDTWKDVSEVLKDSPITVNAFGFSDQKFKVVLDRRVPGIFDRLLTIQSNVGADLKIRIRGLVAPPAQMNVYDNYIDAQAQTSTEVLMKSFFVENTGEGDLAYRLTLKYDGRSDTDDGGGGIGPLTDSPVIMKDEVVKEYEQALAPDGFEGAKTFATSFTAGENGFELTKVKSYFRTEDIPSSEVTVSIMIGGKTPSLARTIYTERFTVNRSIPDDNGAYETFSLQTPQQIYPNETYYVSLSYDGRIALPQAYALGSFPHKFWWLEQQWLEFNGGVLVSVPRAFMLKSIGFDGEDGGQTGWASMDLTGTVPVGEIKEVVMTLKAAEVLEEVNKLKITVTPADPSAPVQTVDLTFTVNQPPVFIAFPVDKKIVLSEGEELIFDVKAEDGEGNSFRFTYGSLPAWLTKTESVEGVIQSVSFLAKPDFESAGNHVIQITATDEHGQASTLDLTIEVKEVNQAPVAVPQELIEVLVKNTRRIPLVDLFTDADGDTLTYELASLPADGYAQVSVIGDELLITGLTSGKSTIEVFANDGKGGIAMLRLSVTVRANSAPVFAAQPAIEVKEGTWTAVTVEATDADGDAVIYQLAEHPAWLTMVQTGNQAVLTAAPGFGTKGDYTAALTANDGQGNSARLALLIKVSAGNSAPVAAMQPEAISISVGDMKQLSMTGWFSDADGDPLSYEAQPVLPESSVQVSVFNGELLLSGLKEGRSTVAVLAHDGKGGIGMLRLEVTVKAKDDTVDPIPDLLNPLLTAFPNPASSETTLRYNVLQTGSVEIRLFDATGKLLSVLLKEAQEVGKQEVLVNISGLQSGIYYYQLIGAGLNKPMVNSFIKQ